VDTEMNHLLWVQCRCLCNQHQVSANIPADREPGVGPALITTMQELEELIVDKLARGWRCVKHPGLTVLDFLREAGYPPAE
jgi:hypothetical protein